MKIGKAIRDLRKAKGLKQKELAELVSISSYSLSRIEKGHTQPRQNLVKEICHALQIPPSYLGFFALSGEDVPEAKQELFNTLNGMIRGLVIEEIHTKNAPGES